MVTLQRNPNNPILIPDSNNAWEHDGAFNGCVTKANGVYHMVYRAFSSPKQQNGVTMQVSSIGYAQSKDGIHFSDHRLLFSPTEDWEIYGCEDPRITYFNDKFYIFYTALSVYPFAAYGIKIAVAVTKDFQTFQKYPVTSFNSKAMGLFPEKVNGKMAALLTINTDVPPAKIALATFENEEDIWSPLFWIEWYDNVNSHMLYLLRDMRDQVELGAPPVKTDDGWLFIYSYIKNYMSNDKEFRIEAALLDYKNPRKILARTDYPLLLPQEKYELEGIVPNVIFPSGARVENDQLFVYYGAADTRCALASCNIKDLLNEMKSTEQYMHSFSKENTLTRFEGNPILTPSFELEWQAMAVYNPAAIYEAGKVHLVYRAQAYNGTSVMGYASSKDGFHIDENLDYPIYFPKEPFERKKHEEGNSGCEDPRLTKIGDRFYMTYTAYDGSNPPRVALTSISVEDFLNKRWNWERSKLISPPGVDDKDACIVKNVKGDGYIAFHRLGNVIWIDKLRDLEFPERKYLSGGILAQARSGKWDDVKIGIAGPPLETKYGWLLFYHGVYSQGSVYKVGAMLLDYTDPKNILGRSDEPILEPEMPYELEGQVPNVVFPCGQVVINDIIYVYYGGGDSVIGVATIPLDVLLDSLLKK